MSRYILFNKLFLFSNYILSTLKNPRFNKKNIETYIHPTQKVEKIGNNSIYHSSRGEVMAVINRGKPLTTPGIAGYNRYQ